MRTRNYFPNPTHVLALVTFLLVLATFASGQSGVPASSCADCPVWNTPQQPFRIYGNTYYVGPHGLSSILITSKAGHVLIDSALPESVSQVVANIRSLGFRVEDVKLIVNSHVHFDHGGGISELQRLSGAQVAASPWSVEVSDEERRRQGRPTVRRRLAGGAGPARHNPARRPDATRRRHTFDRSLHPRPHSRRDKLDLEVVRRQTLSEPRLL